MYHRWLAFAPDILQLHQAEQEQTRGRNHSAALQQEPRKKKEFAGDEKQKSSTAAATM
jgi:hypothetical protein